jgi:HPt (histidine-containing phosphotransfer) domain-containing protein
VYAAAAEKNYFANVPIVALTANAVAGAREFFLNAQMTDFISKPIEASSLNNVLFRLVPKKKIVLGEKPKAKRNLLAATRTKDEGLLLELSSVFELTVQDGLRYTGDDIERYIQSLCWFCENMDAEVWVLKEAMEHGDWKSFSIKAHAFKGILATLGANTLSEQGRFLEFASKEGKTDECLRDAPQFIEGMSVFRSKLIELPHIKLKLEAEQEKAEQAKTERAGKPVLDTVVIKDKLISFADACAKGKTRDIDGFVEEFKNASCPDSVQKSLDEVYTLINSFDFDEAAVKLHKIERSL